MKSILTQEELCRLVTNYFHSDVAKIGKSSLEIIVEDFLEGGKENVNFETPSGGHNYDYISTTALIVGILQLLVASADYLSSRNKKGEKSEPKVVINFITLNYKYEPIHKITENIEVLDEISKIVGNKDDENTQA